MGGQALRHQDGAGLRQHVGRRPAAGLLHRRVAAGQQRHQVGAEDAGAGAESLLVLLPQRRVGHAVGRLELQRRLATCNDTVNAKQPKEAERSCNL